MGSTVDRDEYILFCAEYIVFNLLILMAYWIQSTKNV